MPYKNIVWVKLKLELLDDRRWQDLCNERQQLLYIKLLMLAGKLDNMIPNDPKYLCRECAYRRYPNELARDIQHLSTVFDKFSVDSAWIQFLNFKELHNLGTSHKQKNSRSGDVPEKRRRREEEEKRDSEKLFNDLWDQYPKKDGKKEALKHYTASVKTEQDYINICKALENYKLTDNVKKGNAQYIKNGSTWFNNWGDWVDYKPPVQTAKREFVPGNR